MPSREIINDLYTKQIEKELESLKSSIKLMGDMAINIIINESDAGRVILVDIENDQGKQIDIGERLTDCELTKIRISVDDIFLHKSA